MTNSSVKPTKKRKNSEINGTHQANRSVAVDPVVKKLKLKKELHKVAKVDEINQLKATERLYHSNFFHLQTDELLKETKVPEKRTLFIETFFNGLADFLKSLPTEEEENAVHELKWLKKNPIVPPIGLDIPFDAAPIKFRFVSPRTVFPIGSFRSQTIINANPTVDICAEIPAEFFSKGNHLNGIYHRKKALYLSYIALKIKKWDQIADCKFTYVNGNPLQPVLILEPAGKHGKHIHFHLRVICGEESFKIERLSPEKSNVKQLSAIKPTSTEIVKNTEHTATPYYNSSILGDLNTKFNDEYLYNTISDNPHVRDAIILLKIWLTQREYNIGQGGFNGFILSMFVAYLIQKNLITASMNSYQIIRQVWIHLANTSWIELGKSVSIYESKFRTTQPDPEIFHQYFDVVFIDATGYYNICANLSSDLYRRVQYESAMALKLLNNEHINSFRFLFATKIPLYAQVDHIVRFDVGKILNKPNNDDIFNFCGHWYPYTEKLVLAILRKGLDKRIHTILPITNVHEGTFKAWNTQEQPNTGDKILKIGLILNPEYALDILDKGPQSNLPEAEEYRQFWGSKSELRRFQDGSISEACVWGSLTSSLVEKRLICKMIVQHLLNHHFNIEKSNIHHTAAQMDKAFSVNECFRDFLEGDNNAENMAIQVVKSFDELGKHLRSLELPLVITSVLGQSPVFRYCELLPIIANARLFSKDDKATFNAPIVNHGVIQFETSGKWPTALDALQRVKAAFCLQIARGLRKKFHLRAKVNVDSIDVIKDGYMFRYKIAVPREIALHMKEVTTKGVTKYRDTTQSITMERELILQPKITVSLHTLYHQHPSFGPTVLLAKRWLYSQLIDSFLFDDLCTELLVANQYDNIIAAEPATQPQTAFIRFLHMLAHTNWNTELILMNFNNDLSREYIEKLELEFISTRTAFPPLCIITSMGEPDKHTIWSKKTPTVKILARITLLARHAIKLVQQTIFNDFIAGPLFTASTDGYNLLINLNQSHSRENLVYEFSSEERPFIPMSDYNPIESYLNELRIGYGHVAMFFYNPCGGQQIAVLWKPNTYTKQDFKISAAHGQMIATDDGQLELNHEQLKNDFQILGKGLNGIKGVLVNGTTGEGVCQRIDERKRKFEEWRTSCRKYDMKCMVQIGGTTVSSVYDLAEHAEEKKADAVLCLPDLFFKPTCAEDLVDYLKKVAEYCPTRPFFYYHIPSFTKVNVPMQRFCNLVEKHISTFNGIKFTSSDLNEGVACLKPGRKIFLGSNTIILGALAQGFDSTISTTSNLYPKLVHEIFAAVQENRWKDAQKAQNALIECFNECSSSLKGAFNHMNTDLDCGPSRKPALNLNKN